MITGDEFKFLVEFLGRASGLELTLDKGYLVRCRLEPLADTLGMESLSELLQQLRANKDSLLAEAVAEAMATQETLFFRDPNVFEALRDLMLPTLLAARPNTKRLRIWSAGCAFGQEAYSIAITLSLVPQLLKDWHVEILATDLSRRAIEQAQRGVFGPHEVQRGLSVDLLHHHFTSEAGGWKIHPEIARRVVFKALNLIQPFSHLGTFDIIFCRNVLIYFTLAARKQVLGEIARALAPDGFLVLGSSENTLDMSDQFVQIEQARTSIYRKKGGAHGSR